MQKAKCTNCGAEFEVDEKQEAIVCKECQKPLVVKDTIKEYNESLDPNSPIIRDQEKLDKVNYRVKFGYYSIIALVCYISMFIISLVSTLIIYAKNDIVIDEAEGVLSAFMIVVGIVAILLLVSNFLTLLKIKNALKYNKKIDIKGKTKAFKDGIITISAFVGLLSLMAIITSLVFGGIESITIIIGFVATAVITGLLTYFTIEVEKIIKNTQ